MMSKARKTKTRSTVRITYDSDSDAGHPHTQRWVQAQSQNDNIFLPPVGRRRASRRFLVDPNTLVPDTLPKVQHLASSDFEYDDQELPDDGGEIWLGVEQDCWRSESDYLTKNSDSGEESGGVSEPESELEELENRTERTKVLFEWLGYRDELLTELLRLDGLAEPSERPQNTPSPANILPTTEDSPSTGRQLPDVHINNFEGTVCSACTTQTSTLARCIDCFGSNSACPSCVVDNHKYSPLHRVEIWTGSYWKKTTLKALGLVIQFGHATTCPTPDIERTLTVIGSTGIQSVRVHFCNCSRTSGRGGDHYNQLIRARWFPASPKKPRTVVTFECLSLFHLLTVQGKLTGYDFYQSLVHLTDNTDLDLPPKRYDEFMRIARLWRHLKLLKRAGLGHEPAGVVAARAGSCTVECPACPHLDICPRNEAHPYDLGDHELEGDMSWLDTLFVMLDANFRLRSKNRGIESDPALGSGLAYYVEEDAYKAFLATCPTQTEMNVCDSGLHAVDHANTRGGDKYNASGVGACQCRHMLVRKNGVGDLQKGERYCNMDYIFWSAVEGCNVNDLTVSYDICCQWCRHLFDRVLALPEHLQETANRVTINYVIPKFHIYAHGKLCQSRFSLNFLKHMGRTDGENIERGWAWMNPASLSTREMAPGSRRDALDDQWSSWNFRLLVRLGHTLSRRLYEAVFEARTQRKQHEKFSSTFEPSTIEKWTKMVDEWTEDPFGAPDPFQEPESNVSMADVRQELNEEETADLLRGVMPLHATSASQFLAVGLELQEQQRVLAGLQPKERPRARSASLPAKKTTRATSMDDKDLTLRRKILIWLEVQRIYMPCTMALRSPVSADDSEEDEGSRRVPTWEIPLYLPSSIKPEMRMTGITPGLVEKEVRLRIAQAEDSLFNLKLNLRRGASLWDHKHQHTAGTGTRANTRMQSMIARYTIKQQRDADRYRAARAALISLNSQGSYSSRFPVLHKGDIRFPQRMEGTSGSRKRKHGEGEGRRTIPWIWTRVAWDGNLQDDSTAAASTNTEMEEGLRVEWAKSFARAERWEEEILLIREEMRRCLAFLDSKAQWWRAQASRRKLVDIEIVSGLEAYAEKQARLRESLAFDFASNWLTAISDCALPLPTTWIEKYLHVSPAPRMILRRRGRNKLISKVLNMRKISEGESSLPEAQET